MSIQPTHDPIADSSELAQDFSERVRANQERLTSGLEPSYDFIVCGSGSSGWPEELSRFTLCATAQLVCTIPGCACTNRHR